MQDVQHIVIEDDGRLLAEAVVETHPDLVDAMLRVESDHIAAGTTVRLVNAVLDLIQVPAGTTLEMTFPTGQAKMLLRSTVGGRRASPRASSLETIIAVSRGD